MTTQSDALPVRTRRRKKVRPAGAPPPAQTEPRAELRGLPAGWRVIAAKEFADHVLSIRFLVLTIVLTLAAAAAVYATAGAIREIAEDATEVPSLFLKLFTVAAPDSQIPPFVSFIAFLGPLLGIAFGFDGINGERSEGTLPKLVSQPIHRDDVINGKFVAGLSAIGVIFVAITGVVAAIGVLQLGILPQAEEVLRLMVWIIVAVAYVGLWLALALLCSVLLRRAATSALVAIAAWLLVTLFATLLTGLIAGVLAPAPADATSAQQLANLSMRENLARLSPSQLFSEATGAILDPSVQTFNIVSLIEVNSEQRAIPSILSFDQSLLVIWPQFVGLIALTAVAFAAAYVSFMRQEIRA
jgi:ABC-2 type transport system permease protein